MAAVAAVCVILGSAAAVSERAERGNYRDSGSYVATPGPDARSETVVAFGTNKVGAAGLGVASDGTHGARTGTQSPRASAPASLSTAQPEGVNNAGATAIQGAAGTVFHVPSGSERVLVQDVPQRRTTDRMDSLLLVQRRPKDAARRRLAAVAALRRYIAAKHRATLQHTRLLGRPAFPTAHRWRTTRSIPYLKHLAVKWSVRARTAWLVVVWVREPENAIRFVWGSRWREALTVARCESGLSVYAANGQYRGLFQVSEHWRRTIPGFGWTALQQARHAYGVFRATGYSWSHWQCSEHGGLRW